MLTQLVIIKIDIIPTLLLRKGKVRLGEDRG